MDRINPHIRWRWEGDTLLLNTFLAMNKTAGEVLDLYNEFNDGDLVVHALTEKYPDVPYKNLYNDTYYLLEQFKKWNIIIPHGSDNVSVPIGSYHTVLNHVFNNRLSAPVQVACEITSRCNAHCPHCSLPFTSVDELTTEEWITIIDQMVDINVFTVTFTGGEPLLRKDLSALIQYATEKGLHVIVATNGFTMTGDTITQLVTAGMKTVMMSIDGPDAKTHDTFRELTGSFDKVVKAISVLQDTKAEVVILTAVTTRNVEKVPDIIEFVHSADVTFLDLMRLVSIGRAKKSSLEPSLNDYLKLIPKIKKMEEKYPDLHIEYPNLPAVLFEKTIGLDYYEQLKSENRIEIGGSGIVICTIDPCGNVKLCDFPSEVYIGNVKEKGLKAIWDTSEVFHYIRGGGGTAPDNPCVFGDMCIVRYKSFAVHGIIQDSLCRQCYNTFRKEVTK